MIINNIIQYSSIFIHEKPPDWLRMEYAPISTICNMCILYIWYGNSDCLLRLNRRIDFDDFGLEIAWIIKNTYATDLFKKSLNNLITTLVIERNSTTWLHNWNLKRLLILYCKYSWRRVFRNATSNKVEWTEGVVKFA